MSSQQGRTAQLRDLDDAEDLLDTLDLELEKGDLDYLSHGRERLLRRRRLPSCSAALVDAASAVERAEQERRSRRPEVRADSSTPEQMTDIGKVMKNLDLLWYICWCRLWNSSALLTLTMGIGDCLPRVPVKLSSALASGSPGAYQRMHCLCACAIECVKCYRRENFSTAS